MPTFVRLLAAALTLSTLAGPAAAADLPTDKGKLRLPALFAPTLAAAGKSVARVKCGGKNAALATVVRADGYLLTKGSELRGDVVVALADGTEYPAVRAAYHKETDLALLKIDAAGLPAVAFASDAAGEVGDWVAAPGPAADPLAVGVVSVAARKLYQDQATIENGNKGVMGILFGRGDAKSTKIAGVMDGSGADRAGLKEGDVVREVGGKEVTSRDMLLELLDSYKPGDRVKVLVQRGADDTLEYEVKLGAREDRSTVQNTMGSPISGRRTGFPRVIQHDTVLKPVDCGGPLIDLDGRVLGLNIARAGRVETWALPPGVIKPVLKEMLDGKYAVKE